MSHNVKFADIWKSLQLTCELLECIKTADAALDEISRCEDQLSTVLPQQLCNVPCTEIGLLGVSMQNSS